MNVLADRLEDTNAVPHKGCDELKFANGGHLIAIAAGQIYIYNFFTMDLPTNYTCKGHSGIIKCIEWAEDDMGFTSCGLDGNVLYYDLQL